MKLLELEVRDNKGFYGLCNTPNAEWTQTMLNGNRAHKRFSLLSRNFTATPAVQRLRSEWHVKELATWRFAHATQEFQQSPSWTFDLYSTVALHSLTKMVKYILLLIQ
jgi:hypothetical protein